MSLNKMKLIIETEDIYNKLLPEQKEIFKNIMITDVDLVGSSVIIGCIALKDDIVESNVGQRLLSGGYIDAMD